MTPMKPDKEPDMREAFERIYKYPEYTRNTQGYVEKFEAFCFGYKEGRRTLPATIQGDIATIGSDNTQTVYNMLEERKVMLADIAAAREALEIARLFPIKYPHLDGAAKVIRAIDDGREALTRLMAHGG